MNKVANKNYKEKSKMDILLVEDNEMVAKGLIYSLKQKGYNITHKSNVKNTIKFIQNENVNLIILDISLPDGNGLNLYESQIKDKNIPTIFLTAKDDEETIVKGLEIGADDYITKPFSTRELVARMNKILLKEKKNRIIKVKDIKFDLDKMVVYKQEKEIRANKLRIKNTKFAIYKFK
ncbi:MAG TPA: DNA-binding response regulator [Clostridiales bacterium]|nr:DNA-binding response regulator [Clostridiales bacterium]